MKLIVRHVVIQTWEGHFWAPFCSWSNHQYPAGAPGTNTKLMCRNKFSAFPVSKERRSFPKIGAKCLWMSHKDIKGARNTSHTFNLAFLNAIQNLVGLSSSSAVSRFLCLCIGLWPCLCVHQRSMKSESWRRDSRALGLSLPPAFLLQVQLTPWSWRALRTIAQSTTMDPPIGSPPPLLLSIHA